MATRDRNTFLEHTTDLSQVPSLDLTSPLWKLKEGQASDVRGVDVVSLGDVFQPDRGRKPVGVSIPEADRPLSAAAESNASALLLERSSAVVFREVGVAVGPAYRTFHIEDGVYDETTGTITTSGEFTSYLYRLGDVILIHDDVDVTSHLPGVHPILSKTNDNVIVIEKNLSAANVTFQDGFILQGRGVFTELTSDADFVAAIVKSDALYKKEGPFSSDITEGVFVGNEDGRDPDGSAIYKSNQIVGVGTFANKNDTLLQGVDNPFYAGTSSDQGKVAWFLRKHRDRRGIWVTNGRKFWLQKDGKYGLVMDLGDDDFLGTKWKFTWIARNRFLLVAPDKAPRVLHLNREPVYNGVVEYVGDEVLAGCIAPRRPDNSETISTEIHSSTSNEKLINGSWLADDDTVTGDGLTAGTQLRVLVRGVNLEDNLVSEFVPVGEASNLTIPTSSLPSSLLDIVVGNDDDAVSVFPGACYSLWAPFFHKRITHIEVWRTATSSSGDFYLESRMAIADHEIGEDANGSYRSMFSTLEEDSGVERFPIKLNNDQIRSLPGMSGADEEAGGLPPICQDAVSLLGVTLCFGKADAVRESPTVYARDFFRTSVPYTAPTGGAGAKFTLSNWVQYYTFKEGDLLGVAFGGAGTGGQQIAEGLYKIEAKNNVNEIELDPDGPSPSSSDLDSANHQPWIYILRPYTIEWPAIETDEDVWYSRVEGSVFQPESFPARVKTLSRIGDTFRKAVIVGNYCAVIMEKGVHLLYLNDDGLQVDTISVTGDGTPWADSVIVLEKRVLWATPQGIRVLSVSNQPDDKGHRGTISFLPETNTAEWFREALRNDDTVDVGFDPYHKALRFRRMKEENVYEVLQYSFITKKASILEDDNGAKYVSSAVAEEVEKKIGRLYSVDFVTGAVFLENADEDEEWPYAGYTVEASFAKNEYEIGGTSIRHKTKNSFSPSMVGDIIRFIGPDLDVTRTILKANERVLTFDTVQDMELMTGFLIAPIHFRVRFAPERGRNPNAPKTLHAATLRLQPGERASVMPHVDVCAYENYGTEEASLDTIQAFSDSDAGKTSEDRTSSVEAQGNAVELEIEALHTRNDFRVEQIQTVVHEDKTEAADAVTGSD